MYCYLLYTSPQHSNTYAGYTEPSKITLRATEYCLAFHQLIDTKHFKITECMSNINFVSETINRKAAYFNFMTRELYNSNCQSLTSMFMVKLQWLSQASV